MYEYYYIKTDCLSNTWNTSEIRDFTFRKAGCQPITIPKHEPIKKVYVEMVKQVVEREEQVENE